jgi:alpha-1,6-mannosyltransferase
VLAVAGSVQLRPALRAEATERGLPVRFLGHVGDRAQLAALLASADVVIAPGPVERFGLAALEALASGTPVVVEGSAYAAAVRAMMDRSEAARRTAARPQAERYPWAAAVSGFLAAHAVTSGPIPCLPGSTSGPGSG